MFFSVYFFRVYLKLTFYEFLVSLFLVSSMFMFSSGGKFSVGWSSPASSLADELLR